MFSHEAFAQLDWIVVETTGMADPAPLIQSLYMDAECQARLRLDCVLTVVDSKHLPLHLKTPAAVKPNSGGAGAGSVNPSSVLGGLQSIFKITSVGNNAMEEQAVPEAVLQITFADRILMNKIDLVTPEELKQLFKTVQGINPNAMLLACQNSQVPIEDLLNIRAFDPLQNKALLNISSGGDGSDENDIEDENEVKTVDGSTSNTNNSPMIIQVGADGKISRKVMKMSMNKQETTSSKKNPTTKRPLKLSAAGSKLLEAQSKNKASKSRHVITTVSLLCDRPLDLDKFNAWASQLLTERGADIYRTKGILWMAGYEEQFVVHGVHMIFDGQRGAPWDAAPVSVPATADAATDCTDAAEDQATAAPPASIGSGLSRVSTKVMKRRRYSRLVFIGMALHKEELEAAFLACVATTSAT